MPVRDVTVSQDEAVTLCGPGRGDVQATKETYLSAAKSLSLLTQAGIICLNQSFLFCSLGKLEWLTLCNCPEKLPDASLRSTEESPSHLLADILVYRNLMAGHVVLRVCQLSLDHSGFQKSK